MACRLLLSLLLFTAVGFSEAKLISRFLLDGNALDATGTQDGKVRGTVTWPDSGCGKAVHLNHGDKVDIAKGSVSSMPVGNVPFTVSGWIYFYEVKDRALILMGGDQGRNAVSIDVDGSSTLGCSIDRTWSGPGRITAPQKAQEKRWIHLMCTYDGAKAEFFVDGVSQGTVTRSLTIDYSAAYSGVFLGSRHGGGTAIFAYGECLIDDVRIYDTVEKPADTKDCIPILPAPTPTPTPTVTPTVTPTSTFTSTRTPSSSPSSTATFTSSPTPTPSTLRTTTLTITLTTTFVPSRTPSITTSHSASVSFTRSTSVTVTKPSTASATQSPSTTLSASVTVTKPSTASATQSLSTTLSASVTVTKPSTASATQSLSTTLSASVTVTKPSTASATQSPSTTLSASRTITPTASPRATPSLSSTATISLTPPPTQTNSFTPSSTASLSRSSEGASRTPSLSARTTQTPTFVATSTPSPAATVPTATLTAAVPSVTAKPSATPTESSTDTASRSIPTPPTSPSHTAALPTHTASTLPSATKLPPPLPPAMGTATVTAVVSRVTVIPEKVKGVLAVAGSLSIVAGTAAPTAARLVLLSGQCDGSDPMENEMPFILHPTGFTIFGSAPAGALVGNLALSAGYTAVMGSLLMVGMRIPCVKQRLVAGTLVEVQGFLRFPSTALLVFLFLYQGTIFASLRLVVYPPRKAFRLLGCFGVVVCFAVPVTTLLQVRAAVPTLARYRHVLPAPSRLEEMLLGPGEWVSTERTNHWVHRYSSVIRTYCERWGWFTFLEFVSMFLLAAATIAKTPTWTDCGHVRLFSAVVNFLCLGIEAVLWPHSRARDNWFDFMQHGLQGVSLVFMAIGFYKADLSFWGFETASQCMQCAVYLLLAKVVLDCFCELYVVVTGRRRILQEKEWAEDDSDVSAVEMELLCEKEVEMPLVVFTSPSPGLPQGRGGRGSSFRSVLSHTSSAPSLVSAPSSPALRPLNPASSFSSTTHHPLHHTSSFSSTTPLRSARPANSFTVPSIPRWAATPPTATFSPPSRHPRALPPRSQSGTVL